MRSYKLDEFAAHASAVNCLRIGRKSCGVLVTGGEDRKVNVWAIGKPAAILSLSGHTSGVECVAFDRHEEVVAAGGHSGTVKLWDLGSGKVVRTLTGHRSACLCVEFHPFGDFLVTGSLDTNVKVWDLRRRDCIASYKGHAGGVRRVAVSPDGKWVASGCEAGAVKVWELAGGRCLHSFDGHGGAGGGSTATAVTALEFHPHEFLLASGGADRTVRLYDLERWAPLDDGGGGGGAPPFGPETSAVRALAFHPGGGELLAATGDALKVWCWEPGATRDSVPADWPRLADVAVYEHRLVGASAAGAAVGVHVVDLKRVAPYCAAAASASAAAARRDDGGREAVSPRVGERTAAALRTADELADAAEAALRRLGVERVAGGGCAAPAAAAPALPPAAARAPAFERGGSAEPETWPAAPAAAAAAAAAGRLSRRSPLPPAGFDDSPAATTARGAAAAAAAVAAKPLPTGLPNKTFSSNAAIASPRAASGLLLRAAPAAAASPPRDALLDAAAARRGLHAELSRQLSALQVARGFVGRGNVEGALRAVLGGGGDAAAAAMLLEALQQRRSGDAFELAAVEPLAKAIELALTANGGGGGGEAAQQQRQRAAGVALGALALVLRGPGAVIRDTLAAPAPRGVDLNHEERRDRCIVAKLALQGLGMKLAVLGRGGGGAGGGSTPLAARAQQLMAELERLG